MWSRLITLTFTILLCTSGLFAQPTGDSLRNRMWISGYGYDPNTNENYHTIFDFRGDSLEFEYVVVEGSLIMTYTNASICDTAGNLLFFSNGCGVMDSGFQYIPGAEHINDGVLQNYLCEEVGGGRRPDAFLILPDSTGTSFSLLYTHLTDVPVLHSDYLMWAKVSQNEQGFYYANFIDSIVINQFLFSGNMAACRHADGIHWWVVVPKGLDNVYNILKINNDITHIHTDTIGIVTNDYDDSTGEACFSPDGSKYARYTINADLQVFDFDRCSGHFSNPIHIPIVDAADTIYAAGLAFSPSGRYL